MLLFFRIVLLILVINNLALQGQIVEEPVLNELADKFMNENFPGGARKVRAVIPFKADTLNTLNLFELEPEGWLLLSADKKVEPVIGFSFTGHFKWPDEDINNPMYNWFSLYQKQIKQIVNDKSLKEHNSWSGAKESAVSKGAAASVIRIKPFMIVNWDQGRNWNQFCPVDIDGPGGHVYVGCVAVSMAQAMSIFKIPEKGQGFNNYLDPKYGSQYVNFGNTYYYWNSMSPSVADNFNSLILYHCAVSVNMNFGADGSGTQTVNAASALRNYFSFSQKILFQRRTGTDQEWHDLLIKQLSGGRPIIYAGDADDGKPGHAFNIDGVMSNTYFHINWGWSGSNNGYFTLDALNPGINNFNKNQSAILGIQPFYYPTDITISDSLVKEDLPAGTFVGKLKVIDEAEDNSYVLKLTCDSVYTVAGWIRNFYLEGDSLKTGRVFTASDMRLDTVFISLTDRYNNKLNKAIPLKVGSIVIGTGPENKDQVKDYFIYPNPVEEKLYLYRDLLPGLSHINIYSLTGEKVRSFNLSGYEDGIPVAGLKSGLYILEAVFRDHTFLRQKFIKK